MLKLTHNDSPMSPAHMDWAPHYPAFVDPNLSNVNLSGARKLLKDVEVVDIGCGYGGLLVGLAPLLPETLMVGKLPSSHRGRHVNKKREARDLHKPTGMEIRTQVLDYLRTRIQALRYQQSQLKNNPQSASDPSTQQPTTTMSATESQPDPDQSTTDGFPTTLIPGNYENISALRSNTMKFLPNFFARHQLSKIFICFPDPHFKMRKHKARIVSETLNAEYAYVLRPGGFMYTITDVEEYHHWILKHFRQNDGSGMGAGVTDLFERVSDEELGQDPCVRVMKDATEEGKKVSRNKGHKFVAVFRRKADPEWPA